jgi:hypothetical protein
MLDADPREHAAECLVARTRDDRMRLVEHWGKNLKTV